VAVKSISTKAEDYEYLIGVKVRNENLIIVGTIVSIQAEICGYYKSHNVYAVLDNGTRILVNRLASVCER